MANMCADSGNLMAIAQQLIQQKQQQEQQKQQQEQEQETEQGLAGGGDHFSWSSAVQHQNQDGYGELTETFVGGANGDTQEFHYPITSGFRFSDFDSDEWMGSLIDSTETSSNLRAAWQGEMELANLYSHSDLNRVIFSNPSPAPPPPPTESKSTESTDPSTSSPEGLPILKALTKCARLCDSNPERAMKSVSRIMNSSSQNGDPLERLSYYFSEAILQRVSGQYSTARAPMDDISTETSEEVILSYKAFNDACPYLKFAHFTANQSILEATEKSHKIHIIDFGIAQGLQWAAFLQAVATRPTGKPDLVRITGVRTSSESTLSATGNRLRYFAQLLDLNFEFESVAEFGQLRFGAAPDEILAVNFMFQFHNLADEKVVETLKMVKSLNPCIVTFGEDELNLSPGIGFVSRVKKALTHFAAVFESLEANMSRDSPERLMIEKLLIGQRIRCVVSNDEEMSQDKESWRSAMESLGFKPLMFSNYAVSQAKILLWNYAYSSSYKLMDASLPGFLSLAWNDIPLVTLSSWH